MAIRTASSPLMRIPDGPCSSATVFTGQRVREEAVRDGEAGEQRGRRRPAEPPVPVSEAAATPSWRSLSRCAARTRAIRTAPRKALSNADGHATSSVSATVPPGDPPTLISAPSRRPNGPGGGDQLAGGSGVGTICDGPGGAGRAILREAGCCGCRRGLVGSAEQHACPRPRRVPELRRNQGPGCPRSSGSTCPAIQAPCGHSALVSEAVAKDRNPGTDGD